jgi:sulfotransferase
MNKYQQFVCLSGLPRSGSTLLSAILSQNPLIHAEGNSAVCQMMWDFQQSLLFNCREQIQANERENTTHDILSQIPYIYYKNIDPNEKIIVDKCRSWTIPENIELLKKYIDKDFKIIILERPIIEIVNSFVKLYQKNGRSINIDKLLEPELEPIMRSLRGLLEVKKSQKNQKTDNFLFIKYKDLIENTEETIHKIYDFCNWDLFQHDFQNIIPKYKENDEIYGLHGFHDVHPTIINNTNIIDLPPSILEKCLFLDNIMNEFSE